MLKNILKKKTAHVQKKRLFKMKTEIMCFYFSNLSEWYTSQSPTLNISVAPNSVTSQTFVREFCTMAFHYCVHLLT